MTADMIGGVLGSAVGLAGGIIGTYFSIKNADGPGERNLVYRFVIAISIGIGIFLIGLFTFPAPYNHLLWIPYCLMLSVSIRRYNETLARIRDNQVSSKTKIVASKDERNTA